MRKVARISKAVQRQIIEEYNAKGPDGGYKWRLREIAGHHEISLSSVNKLCKALKCPSRPRGGWTQIVPDARVMKILRDASEPFVTYERVGIMNPRVVTINGVRKPVPLSRQRVAKIIATWQKKLKNHNIHGKGFKPGDVITWSGKRYAVLQYDSSHRGVVLELPSGPVVKPFCWVYQGERSVLVEATSEDLTPEQVISRYIKGDDDRAKAPATADRAPTE